MNTIAVFFGGRSNEREISVITGMYCVNLLRERYRVLPVYIDPAEGFLLGESLRGVEDFRSDREAQTRRALKPVFLTEGGLALKKRPKKVFPLYCALNCCHGGDGEGGVLSALLAWHKIASASPDMTASAVFLDKTLSKAVLKGMGVPVLPAFSLREEEFAGGAWREEALSLGYPLVVKPAKLGSSVGISVARTEEELERALALAFRLDEAALIEKYLSGKRDLNIAAYRRGEEIVLSPVEEVFSGSPVLTFEEKYEGAGERRHELPAKLPEGVAEKAAKMLKCVYAQFGMRGVVRADLLLSEEGELYWNELNTVPGTLAAYLFSESLSGARDLLVALIEEGGKEKRAEKRILDSGILSSAVFGGKNGLKRHI